MLNIKTRLPKPGGMSSVNLDELNELPDLPGLYFVVSEQTIYYIGISKNIRKRWKNHHKHKQVVKLIQPCIHFVTCNENEDLLLVERMCILHYKPLLNSRPGKQSKSTG